MKRNKIFAWCLSPAYIFFIRIFFSKIAQEYLLLLSYRMNFMRFERGRTCTSKMTNTPDQSLQCLLLFVLFKFKVSNSNSIFIYSLNASFTFCFKEIRSSL